MKDIVEIKLLDFSKDYKFKLVSGETLGPMQIAYETYGQLNLNMSNAILVLHAFSGDSHAAGYYVGEDRPGWWDNLIGPGKAMDTDKYFVICSNVIGGCSGSTGPSSINHRTGKPYGSTFPMITIEDMVNAQKLLIDHLGISKLYSIIGGSMGGMQVLQWVSSYPEMVRSAIPVATTLKHSPQQIAFDEVGRQSIMADAAWKNGNYYDTGQPEKGLSVARMIGHITYMSDESMEKKFSRKRKNHKINNGFKPDFEVEGYLEHRGLSFADRFDSNSYLYITKAMDYFDLSGDKLFKKGKDISTKFLVIAFLSDWLYPIYQSQEIIKILKTKMIDASYCEIKSTYGHDAFLLETEDETKLIKNFLKNLE